MDQHIKEIAKDAGMAISAGIVYGMILYISNGVIHWKSIMLTFVMLFIVWRSMRWIAARVK